MLERACAKPTNLARVVATFSLLAAPSAVAQERIDPVQPISADQLETDFDATASASGNLGITRVLTARFDLGPFRVSPGIGAGAGLESTARVSESLRLSARFFIDTGPQLDIILPLGAQHRLSASGYATYRWYTSADSTPTAEDERRWFWGSNYGYQFSGQRLSVSATYQLSSRAESTLDAIDRGTDAADPELEERVRIRRQTVGGRAQFALNARSFLGVQATRSDIDYDPNEESEDPVQSVQFDRIEYSFGGFVGHRLAPWVSVQVGADATRSDYLPEFSVRNNFRTRATLQANFSSERRLMGTAAVGVERRDVDDERLESHTGPFVNLTVRYRLTPRIALWALGRVRTTPSFWENNVYAIDQEVGGGVDVQILRTLNLRGLLRFGTLKFPEPTEIGLPDGSTFSGKRLDSTTQYEGTITWGVFGQSLGTTIGYRIRQSNVESANRRGLFVRLNLSASFGKQL